MYLVKIWQTASSKVLWPCDPRSSITDWLVLWTFVLLQYLDIRTCLSSDIIMCWWWPPATFSDPNNDRGASQRLNSTMWILKTIQDHIGATETNTISFHFGCVVIKSLQQHSFITVSAWDHRTMTLFCSSQAWGGNDTYLTIRYHIDI